MSECSVCQRGRGWDAATLARRMNSSIHTCTLPLKYSSVNVHVLDPRAAPRCRSP